MGEIADSMIDGEFDFMTGEYIGEGVGYPRTFSGNGRTVTPTSRARLGVVNYLTQNGYEPRNQMPIIKGYFKEDVSQRKKDDLCVEIQKDFKLFKKYIQNIK